MRERTAPPSASREPPLSRRRSARCQAGGVLQQPLRQILLTRHASKRDAVPPPVAAIFYSSPPSFSLVAAILPLFSEAPRARFSMLLIFSLRLPPF